MKLRKKGKACLAGLISLILVASIGVSVVSYKGTFMEVKPVSRVAEANQNTFEGKEELEELMNLNLKYILNDWWNSEKLDVLKTTHK